MKRVPRRIVAPLVLFCLLFGQMAVAAYACPGTMSDARVAAQQDDGSPCDQGNANLCEQHCAYGASSAYTHAPAAPPADRFMLRRVAVSGFAPNACAERLHQARGPAPPFPPPILALRI